MAKENAINILLIAFIAGYFDNVVGWYKRNLPCWKNLESGGRLAIYYLRSNNFSASSQLSRRSCFVSFTLCSAVNIIALPSKTDKLKSWSSISISPFKTLLSPQRILRFQCMKGKCSSSQSFLSCKELGNSIAAEATYISNLLLSSPTISRLCSMSGRPLKNPF